MQTVNVSSLKNNPSEALRSARNDLVVVMNRDQPDAVMIGLQSGKLFPSPVRVQHWPRPYFVMEACHWQGALAWRKCLWPTSSPMYPDSAFQ